MLVALWEHCITASVFFTLGCVFMALLQIAKEPEPYDNKLRKR